MKTKYILPVLIISILFAFHPNAIADGDENDSHDECSISGNEVMDAVVVLTATTNAPGGAMGVAKIEAENDDGDEAATLELKTAGLAVGDYLLSVIRQSDGTNIFLGTVQVRNDDGDDDDESEGDDWHPGDILDKLWGDNGCSWIDCNWGGFTNWGSWTNWSIPNWCNGSNQVLVTETEFDLPADLNPTDI